MLSSILLHKDFKPLIITTQEIGVAGFSLITKLEKELVTALLKVENQPSSNLAAALPLQLTVEITRENDTAFLVSINTKVTLSTDCVRCLNPILLEIPLNFSIRMLEGQGDEEKDELVSGVSFDSFQAEDQEECLVGYFTNHSIDVGLILREQIFLTVPDYPHCDGPLTVNPQECEVGFKLAEENEGRRPFATLLKKL